MSQHEMKVDQAHFFSKNQQIFIFIGTLGL